MLEAVPSISKRYPPMWGANKHISRIVRNILLSVGERPSTLLPHAMLILIVKEELCYEFAAYFEGKSMEELNSLAKSFTFGEFPFISNRSECTDARDKRSELQAEDETERVFDGGFEEGSAPIAS